MNVSANIEIEKGILCGVIKKEVILRTTPSKTTKSSMQQCKWIFKNNEILNISYCFLKFQNFI